MPVQVKIPTALRKFADNTNSLELEGASVGEVLHSLTSRFPELKKHLFTGEGQLRNFVNVFVNDGNIRDLQAADTPLKPGDEVSIVPAIAGGG